MVRLSQACRQYTEMLGDGLRRLYVLGFKTVHTLETGGPDWSRPKSNATMGLKKWLMIAAFVTV